MTRPSFGSAWRAFMAVKLSVKEVGKKIGGHVQQNIELPINGFENACPIRMSYVLNVTGFPIPKSAQYRMVSGGDGRQYIYRLDHMMTYLERTFGKPDKTVRFPKSSDFANTKGILVVKGSGWGNARGHVTLRDGTRCSDNCHFMHDPENGRFTPETASIWILR